MKVTYIYHSGFSVELEEHTLIFDYFKGALPHLQKDKKTLFFASHKHADHFNMDIFDYYGQLENLHYFLGSDIKLSDRYLERNGIKPAVREALTCVRKNASAIWEDVTVETLRSTDAGVAFIVTVEGKTIYHAGDLNWWRWEGESAQWNDKMEQDYKRELALIAGRHFDAAFVVLDPRLGKSYDLGMYEFLKNVDADAVFPIHMWDEYDVISRFCGSAAGRQYAGRIMRVTAPGQEFTL